VQRIGGSLGAPEWAVVIAVQAFAAGSVSGRVGWGLLLEAIGAKRAITASLVLQGVCLVSLALLGGGGAAFLVTVFLVGFNYGGCFVLYVAEVVELYGPERVGTVYSRLQPRGAFGAACRGGEFRRYRKLRSRPRLRRGHGVGRRGVLHRSHAPGRGTRGGRGTPRGKSGSRRRGSALVMSARRR
ncbi:MAG: hypothetical protein ACYTAN_16460, partial [Planctomycetota bacterium]